MGLGRPDGCDSPASSPLLAPALARFPRFHLCCAETSATHCLSFGPADLGQIPSCSESLPTALMIKGVSSLLQTALLCPLQLSHEAASPVLRHLSGCGTGDVR